VLTVTDSSDTRITIYNTTNQLLATGVQYWGSSYDILW